MTNQPMHFVFLATMDGNMLLAAKSLHIIFVVAWFAGLFYVPRLFIYHTEARDKSQAEREILTAQYKLMTRRLWYIITWPACILAVGFAIWMLVLYPPYLQMAWMQLKLAFVVILLGYHFSLHWLFRKLQTDRYPMTGTQLRFYNELATILLFAIVFTAVFKNTSGWYYGVLGIVGLGVVLSISIMLYKKARNRRRS